MEGMYKYGFVQPTHLLRRIKQLAEKYRITVLMTIIILSSVILVLSLISMKVTAEKSITREKHVISVQVQKGDSLWSIASQYITDDYDDMNMYIKEIMYSNGLTSDTIHEGNYIIVPYYSSIH